MVCYCGRNHEIMLYVILGITCIWIPELSEVLTMKKEVGISMIDLHCVYFRETFIALVVDIIIEGGIYLRAVFSLFPGDRSTTGSHPVLWPLWPWS